MLGGLSLALGIRQPGYPGSTRDHRPIHTATPKTPQAVPPRSSRVRQFNVIASHDLGGTNPPTNPPRPALGRTCRQAQKDQPWPAGPRLRMFMVQESGRGVGHKEEALPLLVLYTGPHINRLLSFRAGHRGTDINAPPYRLVARRPVSLPLPPATRCQCRGPPCPHLHFSVVSRRIL